MRISLLKLGITILFIALAAVVQGGEEAELDKPVTLAIKGEALSDIMPMLEEQTSVRLRVSHEIADQKATIFVDDKPLKQVMSGLAKLFQCKWSYTEFEGRRTYTLSMPGKVLRERKSWHERAVDQAWKDLDAEMKRMAEMPVKSREELDRLFDQTESPDGSLPEVYRVSGYDSERRKKAVARLYRTLSPDLLKALRDGMTICWDLESPEPEWKIPAALEAEFREGTIFYDVELNFTDKRKKHDFGTLTVELSASSTPDKFRIEVYERLGKGPGTIGYVFRAYEKPLSQLLPSAENSLPRTGDFTALDRKVSYTTEELKEEAALSELPSWDTGIYINRSDLLAILHEKLGLQIISDHYSHWYNWGACKDRTVKDILDSFEHLPGAGQSVLNLLAKPNPKESFVMHCMEMYPEADWGWDGKLLYMRARDIARMDSREIPNRLLRRWQAVSTDFRYLGLDDLAEIQMLTDEQLSALRGNLQYFGIARGYYDSLDREQGLYLYGLLDPNQRRLLFNGGLSTQGFTPEQRTVLIKLISEMHEISMTVRQGERVGIYDELGFRIDKPDIRMLDYPASVEMVVDNREECVLSAGRIVEGKSFEEAMKEARSEKERASIKKGILTNYKMIFRGMDGSEIKTSIRVLTLAPNDEPAQE